MARRSNSTVSVPAGYEMTRRGVLVPGGVRAKYDSAQTTSNNKRHWANADALSADAANSLAVRSKLRNRARYEYANNSYVHGIINSIAYDTIGSGPALQVRSDNSLFRADVEKAWAEWSDMVRLAQTLHVMVESRIRDGEVFAVFTNNPGLMGAVKLFPELVECDRVTSSLLDSVNTGADGITLDTYGNPVAYRILKTHPGEYFTQNVDSAEEVRADMVAHYYAPNRPNQHRGIPEITPALELCILLRRYTLAVVTAAETAADNAYVLETTGATDTEYDPDNDLEELQLERNLVTVLPEGYKLSQTKAEQPTTTYPDFKNEILNEIARCLGVPFNVAAGNSSEYNYSSGRLDHKTYEKKLSVDQAQLERVFLNRAFEKFFFEWAASNGMAGAPLPDIVWYWEKLPHIDPVKEAQAQVIRIDAGLTTRTREAAREKVDYEDLLAERKREKELEDNYGVSAVDVSDTGTARPTDGDQDNEQV